MVLELSEATRFYWPQSKVDGMPASGDEEGESTPDGEGQTSY